jgi:hypothetical protein
MAEEHRPIVRLPIVLAFGQALKRSTRAFRFGLELFQYELSEFHEHVD